MALTPAAADRRNARRPAPAARPVCQHRPPDRQAPHSVGSELLPDYQELRTQAHLLKKHTIDHLDHYLESSKRNVIAHGGKVVWCDDCHRRRRFRPLTGEGARGEAHRQIEVDDHRRDRLQRAAGAPRARIGRDRPRRVHRAARARQAVPHRRAGDAHDALRRRRSLHRTSSASRAKWCPRSRR